MSKNLEKSAAELDRIAASHVVTIRRVVREYNEAVQSTANGDQTELVRKQREIERAVAQYDELQKAIKRLHKKMRVKQ